jgi:uncharacterized MAPEG superfamily protein
LSGGGLVTTAAMAYFFGRLAHYVLYTLGVPVLRTLSFFVCMGAMLVLAYVILTGLK